MRETLCRCAKDKRSGKQAGRRYTTNTLTYILSWLSQQRPHGVATPETKEGQYVRVAEFYTLKLSVQKLDDTQQSKTLCTC